MADDEIMKHRGMAILERLLKHIRIRDLAELMESLVTLLSAGHTTNEPLSALMNWMLQTGDTAQPKLFLQELARRSPQHKAVLMTIEQRLKQETGQLVILKIALAMLKNGIDRATVMKTAGLTEKELAKIQP